MKHIVVMPNGHKDPGYIYSRRILHRLIQLGACPYLPATLKSTIRVRGIQYYDGELPEQTEMILVIGGDGSVLDAAVYAIGADVPILGINLGRLGYLAELEAEEADELARLFTGDFTVREHMTFDVSLIRSGEEMHLVHSAVNDVVLSQGEGEGLSELRLEDGVGNHLTYVADGMIVATPLGSTAYSLAAGGPVVDASLAAFCVTPICAHSLFSRSVLFPPEYTIALRNISSRGGLMRVTVDGDDGYTLEPGDCVRVSRSAKVLRMITLKNRSALGVLCRKMQLLNPKL